MERYSLLYGVVPESEMTTLVSFDIIPAVLSALHVSVTQLGFLEPIVTQCLNADRGQPSVSIQRVFSVFRDPRVVGCLSDPRNEYGSVDSARLINSAMYLFGRGTLTYCLSRLKDISACVKVTTEYQRTNASDGVPLSIPTIRSLLKEMDKYLPGPVLKLWIDRTAPYLRFKDTITSAEFLFLLANCKTRAEAVSSLPYQRVSVTPTAGGLYEIDEIVNYPGHPDLLLESLAEKYTVLDRVVFAGNTEKREEKRAASSNSRARRTPEAQGLEAFRREISNTQEMEKIHRVIEICQQKLNAAKLSGRLAFEEKHSASRTHTSPKRTRSARHKTHNFSFLSETPQTRKSFFASTHFSDYVPPDVLFPTRSKFRKPQLRRKRSPPSASLKSPTRTWSLSRLTGQWRCDSSFDRNDTLETSATTASFHGKRKNKATQKLDFRVREAFCS